jgi:hypothetical protein
MSKTDRWEVLLLDVWGNEVDGYEVNDSWRSGVTLEIDDDAQTHEVLSLLCAEMGGNPDTLEIDGNTSGESVLYVQDRTDGRPVCELQRE